MTDRAQRLEAALEAAVRAKNPFLAASIRAAMRGEDYDPFQGLLEGLHPEARDVLDWSEKPTPPPTP